MSLLKFEENEIWLQQCLIDDPNEINKFPIKL